MLKKVVRATLGRFGLQLRWIPEIEPDRNYEVWAKQLLWLTEFRFATVLDIGAHTGQFAQYIKLLLPEARIYSFEPLSDCFEQLQINMAQADNFKAYNLALGNETGNLMFERNEFGPSSSFLKMADLHRDTFPYTRNSESVTVMTRCLDDLSHELAIAEPMLVKIDVQGYENEVLRGGEEIIRRASLIIIETSFETLYEGQPLFNDIYRTLTSWGFIYNGAVDQLCSPQDGRPLQEDSIFVKRSALRIA